MDIDKIMPEIKESIILKLNLKDKLEMLDILDNLEFYLQRIIANNSHLDLGNISSNKLKGCYLAWLLTFISTTLATLKFSTLKTKTEYCEHPQLNVLMSIIEEKLDKDFWELTNAEKELFFQASLLSIHPSYKQITGCFNTVNFIFNLGRQKANKPSLSIITTESEITKQIKGLMLN